MSAPIPGDHILVDRIDAIVVRAAGDGVLEVVYADWKGRTFVEFATHGDRGWTFKTKGDRRVPVDDVPEYAPYVEHLRRVSGPPLGW